MESWRPKWRSPGLPERFLTGSLCGVSPGLSMMISFFRSSSMVLLYVRRGERRSLSDARRRGCPKTFLEFASTCLRAAETERFGGLDFFKLTSLNIMCCLRCFVLKKESLIPIKTLNLCVLIKVFVLAVGSWIGCQHTSCLCCQNWSFWRRSEAMSRRRQ